MPVQRSLRRRIITHLCILVAGTLLMAAAAMWGMNAVQHDFSIALVGYGELRQAYEIGTRAVVARAMLGAGKPEQALAEMEAAKRQLALVLPTLGDQSTWKPLSDSIDLATQTLKRPVANPPFTGVRAAQAGALDGVVARLSTLSSDIRLHIQHHEESAQQKRHAMMLAIGVLSGLTLTAAGVVGIRMYRAVMRPLGAIGEGTRRFAGGKFDERIEPRGDAEFVQLAGDFNHMAGQLDELYRELEQKVADKTAQLLRSARLASVGYLAAGVAHEINNPLGIIAGYGQRAIQQLQRDVDASQKEKIQQAIQIICDEAFRCRGITDKLLSLARPGETKRQRVNLADVAQNVLTTVGGLEEFRDRKLTLQVDPQADVHAWANEAEIKQLLLNLTLNALEAVQAGEGVVNVRIARRGEQVELEIIDNGAGMSRETLDKVFEPFFTEKRGSGRPGTGLGLPIVQAIVDAHGGAIRAESDGPGRGSRFVVTLPATEKVEGMPRA